MSALPKPYYQPAEYLQLERAAEYKSDYLAGEIYAMAEASEAHIIDHAQYCERARQPVPG